EDVRSGSGLQHVREILPAHGRLVIGEHIVLAEYALADPCRKHRLALAVHGRWIATLVCDLSAAAHRFGNTGDNFPDAYLGEVARLRAETAHGADQLDEIGDHVENAGLAGFHRADRNHDRIQ